MSYPLDSRIAIIGAGASGLTIATELKDAGYKNVVVFEKEKRVGGKTFSFQYKGEFFDLGSMMFSRMTDVEAYAKRFQVPYRSFKTTDFYYSHGKYLSPFAYAQQFASLKDILKSLYDLHSVVKESHLGEVGYQEVTQELTQDFRTFLKSHHLEAGAKALEPAITGLGYGSFENTPAMYGMKITASMLDISLIKSLLTRGDQVCFFPGGWMGLWEKVAKKLTVRTGVTITSIKRTKTEGVEISINNKKETFDHLIITAPLNHTESYLDLRAEEKRLFAKIESNRMVSTLVEGSIPLGNIFLADNTSLDRAGHVLGLECYKPETRCSVAFQVLPKGMTKEEGLALLKEDLLELGCEVKKIVTQNEWEYFYHVPSKELAKGFYPKLNALQGVAGTYYANSLLNYETVGHCQQFAKHLVKTYFGNTVKKPQKSTLHKIHRSMKKLKSSGMKSIKKQIPKSLSSLTK